MIGGHKVPPPPGGFDCPIPQLLYGYILFESFRVFLEQIFLSEQFAPPDPP